MNRWAVHFGTSGSFIAQLMFSKKITRFSKLLNSGIWDVIVGQRKITRSGQVNTHLSYPDDMVLREWVPSTYQQIGE